MRWRGYITEIIRYAFIILFLYAAFSQIINSPKFYNDLLNSPVFNNTTAVLVSWIIPIIELIIAGLLLSKDFRLAGIYLALGLLFLFSVYISGILFFSDNIPCSCGGIINDITWQQHLIFNCCFILLGSIGVYLNSKKVFIK
ncbi:hypothetical protein FK178_08595 [Antarcticibacterium arcticum]|uniref:Methylamine utilisation protein MauE domain-containing protein n=1 Tax=Antarcticibacterium arcticum TaxID=2585771 RepID=A0A5B8YKP9_9FLAO|nr:hypothetical protein FK178_08595 [Antarcticibacterium arcticum]